MSRPDFLTMTGLSPLARLLGQLLERLRRGHREVWHATKTLAARLGRSVRSVQLALRELIDAGLVAYHRDYSKTSRHRLELAWVEGSPEPSQAPVVSAKNSAESAQEIALRTPLPPHPPLKAVSEDRSVKREIDCCAPPPLPPRISTAEPDPEPNPEPEPEPAQVAAVLDQARQRLGDTDRTEPWIRQQAREFGWPWLAAAFERLNWRKVARPAGYLRRTLEGWRSQGGPPPGGPRPAPAPVPIPRDADRAGPTAEDLAAEREAIRKEQLKRIFAPPPPLRPNPFNPVYPGLSS